MTDYVRVGDQLGLVRLLATELLPVAALVELAAAQASCFETALCPEPTPLPTDLQEMVDTFRIGTIDMPTNSLLAPT